MDSELPVTFDTRIRAYLLLKPRPGTLQTRQSEMRGVPGASGMRIREARTPERLNLPHHRT